MLDHCKQIYKTALRRAVRSGRVAIAETARRVHGNPTQFPRPRRLPHLRSSAEPGKKQGQVADPYGFDFERRGRVTFNPSANVESKDIPSPRGISLVFQKPNGQHVVFGMFGRDSKLKLIPEFDNSSQNICFRW